jgi:WD40 repeat protein
VDPAQRDLLAAGAYSGGVGLYDAHNHTQVLLLTGHTGGVTQVTFSPCGNFLYSGARQDDALYCWDVRYSQTTVYACKRAARGSNQRLQFDLDAPGRHLATGGTDGCLRVRRLQGGWHGAC